MPVWWAWVAWSWWSETLLQLRALPPGVLDGRASHLVPPLIAGRAIALFAEAGAYAVVGATRGAPLPFWRFFTWIASLSTVDVLAAALRRTAAHAAPIARAIAVAFTGPALLGSGADASGHAATGVMAAFGNVGAFALLRVAMTAWAAARGTGRPLRHTMLVVGAAWIITRLVMLWSFDLFKGMSPVP
ncbi:MAG: hypothetical protein HY076_08930 [Candidatus Eisenbacteria bacterium]|uniref:Uncharacterized protein n=1 Tax=Eiseniibacteriota bacterium TaxID=2212470 RepID=A0A9D6QKN5_UNCEI|nr:hypothetical protein [Candidatus Eisenbacteria bacterium]MBI3540381.1 hypothetical protein [Candidatus Eisenbacteria bacterium]